jgi:hypothetical protein
MIDPLEESLVQEPKPEALRVGLLKRGWQQDFGK